MEEIADPETYDGLADEQPEEEIMDVTEDYSDLADEPAKEDYDGSDYNDLVDKVTEEHIDVSADYSDMADAVDSGSYDDAPMDGSDSSIDSGDTGSVDGGIDSIS